MSGSELWLSMLGVMIMMSLYTKEDRHKVEDLVSMTWENRWAISGLGLIHLTPAQPSSVFIYLHIGELEVLHSLSAQVFLLVENGQCGAWHCS